MKRFISFLLLFSLLTVFCVPAFAAQTRFTDVPAQSSLASEIEKAGQYGLMEGYSATLFGYADPITRAQFVTVTGRMLGWTGSSKSTYSHISTRMQVPTSLAAVYLDAIDEAAAHDAVDDDVPFRAEEPITRAEMAEILVRALGYKSAALQADDDPLPFTDVRERNGYIALAYAIGMTNGTSASTFSPDENATRAQAAAMLVRIYEKYFHSTDFLHAFYAISSYAQIDLSAQTDAVSVGWSRMTWDGQRALLSTTSADGNEYFIPSGYVDAVNTIKGNGNALNLSVYMDTSSGLDALLADTDGRAQAVEQIVSELTVPYAALGSNPYGGVTIDFEGLRSDRKADFSDFMTDLCKQVHALGKSVYVTVQPMLTTGAYFDGYDYRLLGQLADQVILMAHDYEPTDLSGFEGSTYYRNAALSPIAQVYESLRAVTDPDTGVQDRSKLVLAVSCKAVAWQIDEAGKLLSPLPVQVSTQTVFTRLSQADTVTGFSTDYGNAYATYTTPDGGRYFLWYEDAQSIALKVHLAKLMGIDAVSLWRLGTVPDYGADDYAVMKAVQ